MLSRNAPSKNTKSTTNAVGSVEAEAVAQQDAFASSRVAADNLRRASSAFDGIPQLSLQVPEDSASHLELVRCLLDKDGARRLADLGLTDLDLVRAMYGLKRDNVTSRVINAGMQHLGEGLSEDAGFCSGWMDMVGQLAEALLSELRASMDRQGRTYHTIYHTIEMCNDTYSNFSLTARRNSPHDYQQIAAKALVIPLALYHDLVQDQGPWFNEVSSAERLTDDLRLAAWGLLKGALGEEVGLLVIEAVQHLAHLVLVSGTYVPGSVPRFTKRHCTG
eukprot:gene2890-3477_t